jgi:putative aminopeptidase FrvX
LTIWTPVFLRSSSVGWLVVIGRSSERLAFATSNAPVQTEAIVAPACYPPGRFVHTVRRRKRPVTLNEKLLKRLIETPGVPGREERQREIAREELETLTDEVRTDPLGSVIGTKQGRDDARVMVAAHLDEIGFLVKYIDDKGFLRLQTLGGHDPANMVSQRVLVTTADNESLRGALQPARKPPHLARGEDQQKLPKVDEFFVDLGMRADEVKKAVRIGDYVTMDRTLERVGENYLGKAMDDRIGVFVMIEALRAMEHHEATIHAVATSQEEVGLRGAAASGSALEPTVVVALDITIAMDVPGGGNENTITELGKGAAIKIMDSSLICHPKLVEHLRRIAEREGIAHQMEILPQGGTDAGGVQRLHGGIPSVTLSIPTRYVHTPNEMVNASDVEACIDLLARYLEGAHTGDYTL